jgi:hypothetical protein
MDERTRTWRGAAGGLICLAAALLLVAAGLSATAAADGPAGAHGSDRSLQDERPLDCPGRAENAGLADAAAQRNRFMAAREVPAMVRFRAAPYGVMWGYPEREGTDDEPRLSPPPDYRAQVFHVFDCPQDPVGDRFLGVDYLVTLMGREGLKFYRSPNQSQESGPDGIIAADDVVVIKINYQWAQRGGTNTDVLRGLIRRIVDHPDGFAGEIVVCENAQFASTQGFNRSENNAQVITLSPLAIVTGFQQQGVNISLFDWTLIRGTQVTEYSQGNMTNGYVVYPYNGSFNGRLSYPKFQTGNGTYISIRNGIWSPAEQRYDRDRLKFINVPVLKSHHSTYGATVCVKNYMGVVTSLLSTNSHNAIANGILGALMGEIQLADLNILDCIWINANPYTGPATSYGGATRRDMLVASTDPVAADIWAVRHILIPGFLANGYTPPWPTPSADPDNPNSAFRNYLDNSMNRILAAGYPVTNDEDFIDVFSWSGPGDCPGDLNGDGAVDVLDLLVLLDAWGPCSGCAADLNGDGDVDVLDLLLLLDAWGPCPD